MPADSEQARTEDSNRRYFATDHLRTNLKQRTVSSGFVTMTAQGVQFVVNLTSVIILARLLVPQDFGIVAMVTTVTGLLRIFNDAGLSTATIQREGITHAQVSNLFWTNVALGGSITLLLAALSPVVAWFYREPRLIGVTLALSITFVLTSSAVQHLALLSRQMQFKTIAVIQVVSVTLGALVGIIMAMRNWGYWSLVGMQLTTPVVSFLMVWSFSRWRPQLPRKQSGTRSLLNFGANLTASTFLYSVARSFDGLLIGRFYGAAPLGLYNRAGALLMRPVQQFLGPVESVFVPVLSRLQNQPERYRRVVLQAFESIAVISFLFTGLLLGLARPLTLALLGPKWESAAPIFAGFTLVALHMPIGSVATWLLTSQGRGRDFLILSSIGSTLAILSFLVGLPFGPVGVAMSYSAFCLLLALPVTYHIAGRRGPVTAKDLWGRFFTHLPVWIIVCAVTWLMHSKMEDATPWKQLAVCVPVGLLVGIGFVCGYPPSRRVVFSLFELVKEWKASKRVVN